MTRQVLLALVLSAWQAAAWGHAFLDHTEPGVGADVTTPPEKIVLYFDSELEPAFSTVRVEDANGQEIKTDGQNDAADAKQLSITLSPLSAGTYRVLWRVVARDGHRTEGDYTFKIR